MSKTSACFENVAKQISHEVNILLNKYVQQIVAIFRKYR